MMVHNAQYGLMSFLKYGPLIKCPILRAGLFRCQALHLQLKAVIGSVCLSNGWLKWVFPIRGKKKTWRGLFHRWSSSTLLSTIVLIWIHIKSLSTITNHRQPLNHQSLYQPPKKNICRHLKRLVLGPEQTDSCKRCRSTWAREEMAAPGGVRMVSHGRDCWEEPARATSSLFMVSVGNTSNWPFIDIDHEPLPSPTRP